MEFEPIARMVLFLTGGVGILFFLWVLWNLCQDVSWRRHSRQHHVALGETEAVPPMPEEWHEVPPSRRAS